MTRTRASGERGAALVELAVILPLIIMIAFGVVEFGSAWNRKLQIWSPHTFMVPEMRNWYPAVGFGIVSAEGFVLVSGMEIPEVTSNFVKV